MHPSEIITAAVRGHVRPFVRERGFRGLGPTFRRTVGETEQMIQVQRSHITSTDGLVYLNGMIYVPALDELLGLPARTASDEWRCHITLRPDSVDEHAESRVLVKPDSGVEDVADSAVRGIEVLLSRLDTVTTATDTVELLSHLKLYQFERVIGWFLRHDQHDRARAFVVDLYDTFGNESRWDALARRIDDAVAHVSPTTPWRSWIAGVVSTGPVDRWTR